TRAWLPGSVFRICGLRSRDRRILLGWHRGRTHNGLGPLTSADEPSEKQHISKYDYRTDCRNRITNCVTCMHESHREGQGHGSSDPNPDLYERNSTAVDCRV